MANNSTKIKKIHHLNTQLIKQSNKKANKKLNSYWEKNITNFNLKLKKNKKYEH